LGDHWFARWFSCARRAVSNTRLSRVAAVLACTIHSRMPRRAERGKASQWRRASGQAASAAARSSGTTPSSTESSIVQLPSACAASTLARPAGAMRPCAMSRSTRSLFGRAQPEPDLRGANQSIVRRSSSFFGRLSTQPKHSASSTVAS
jgi:hypothetical protein